MAANVCIMLWMRWFDCWNSIAIALMILWMLVACILNVSVNASTHISVLRLMLLVSDVSLSSMVSASSFIALVKSFSETKGRRRRCCAWLEFFVR